LPNLGMLSKPMLGLGLFAGLLLPQALFGQQAPIQETSQKSLYSLAESGWKLGPSFTFQNPRDLQLDLMPGIAASYIAPHAQTQPVLLFDRTAWTSTPGTFQRMESAFYCNDTPFVDQVRFPLATFWRGHVKLTGFESDVTTANFVMGLPGQGALHNLSAFGNAFIATHTPPSDQLAGIHMTFSWNPSNVESGENTGRHGIEYLVRASRSVLPFLGPKADAGQIASR